MTWLAGVAGRLASVAQSQEQYALPACEHALARLQQAGVPLRPDGSAERPYDALRSEWDAASWALLQHSGYGRAQEGRNRG